MPVCCETGPYCAPIERSLAANRFTPPRDLPLDAATRVGLKALSHNAVTRTLIRSLDFLQRYTLAIDLSTLAGAQEQLEGTNAFRDAQRADAEGIRLVLP